MIDFYETGLMSSIPDRQDTLVQGVAAQARTCLKHDPGKMVKNPDRNNRLSMIFLHEKANETMSQREGIIKFSVK